MAKKLDFKDFLTVDYAPGMPDLIKKNAKKRKMDSGAGTNAEYSSTYSPEEQIDIIDEQKGDPIVLGKHAKNVGMGYTGKHTTIKDPGSKKGRHTHVFQFTGEEASDDDQTIHKMLNSQSAEKLLKAYKKLYKREYPGTSKSELISKIKSKVRNYRQAYELMKEEAQLDEAMTAAHKKLAYDVHKQLKRDQSMSPSAGFKLKADHNMLRSKYGSDWRKKAGINEEAQLDEVSQALGHKVAKARQAQASSLRQKAVDEPDMMKAFAHTKAANKAEKKAGQSYNRLMRKEEIELDEYNTKSSKAIVTKDNKPIAIYSDLKSAQKDYYGKDGHAIGMRSASAAMKIKKANPGIKIVESVEEVDEALTLAQRRARGRKMKLKRRQIEIGRKRALKRTADPKRLKNRAEKAARNAIFRRLAKGKSRSEVPPQRKQEIERRMEKMQSRIKRLAVKLLPKVRQIDKERKVSKQDDK